MPPSGGKWRQARKRPKLTMPVSTKKPTERTEAEPFLWPIRVYHEDTDNGGIVYHANHLRFLERARTEWLRHCGYSQEAMKRELGVLFAVRSLEIHYRKPAFLDDPLVVETIVERRRRAALHFRQRLHHAEDYNYTVCEAEVEVACIGTEDYRPRPIPQILDRELTHVD